jgi:hypothetical protein
MGMLSYEKKILGSMDSERSGHFLEQTLHLLLFNRYSYAEILCLRIPVFAKKRQIMK